MTLKVVLDSLDGLSEVQRNLYVQRDGKFVLDAEGVDELETLRAQVVQQERDILRHVADAEATRAILAEHGEPELLLLHVSPRLQVERAGEGFAVRVVDADGRPREMREGPVTVRNFVREMKYGKLAAAFSGTGSSGSGASAESAHGTPWVISRADAQNPAKYRTAKAAAQKAGTDLVYRD